MINNIYKIKMDSKYMSNKEIKSSNQINLQNKFENLKSKYILKKIFDIMEINKSLKIIQFNKSLQQRLDININNYKEYSEIEIEIIPAKYVWKFYKYKK